MPKTLSSRWLAVQHRVAALNASSIREAAASVVIVLVLAIGVVWNLPDSAITRAVSPLLKSIAFPLGLDQNWSMYAPNPPRRQENIEVHIAMADGTDRVWTLPRLNPVFGVAFTHRWRKLKETLVTNQQARPDFVHWVIREMSRPGDRPLRVDMILLTEDIPPPGASGPRNSTIETLYSEEPTGNR